MRKTEPVSGASPPGRYSRAVGVNASNRSRLSSTCWWNVSSTMKPRWASRMAGRSASSRSRVPHSSSAVSQVASVPGTPTATPLVTRSG